MPSLRSKFCRFLTRAFMAPIFNPNKSIAETRRGMERLSKFTSLPSKTRVSKIQLNGISAEWIYGEVACKDNVILYLHGGGYNICSPNTHRETAAHIANASNAKVLLPDYRLAPEHPFPSALQDATEAYRWLLRSGFKSGQIALAGDSAGGGLAIATALALREAGDPPPAAIACISPWTDLALTGESIQTKAQADPLLNPPSLRRMAANYFGDRNPCAPLISPVYADLRDISPMLIQVGSDEILLDDSTRMARTAAAAGVRVTLKVYSQLWHVFHFNAKFMPEAKAAIAELGMFIRAHFTKAVEESEPPLAMHL
jgi:epsilon-lactone hydrolase